MTADDNEPDYVLARRMLDTFGVVSIDTLEKERTKYGPWSKAYLSMAARIVDNSGVVPKIEKWAKEARLSNAGAKATIPARAVLILLLVHIQTGRGANYIEIGKTLKHSFDAEHRAMLGITLGKSDAKPDWYLRMWRATNRLLTTLDPYPAPRDMRISGEEYTALLGTWEDLESNKLHLDKDVYAALLANEENRKARIGSKIKLARINWICEQLVHTSVRMLPRDIWDQFEGNIAIDATKLEIAGRVNSTNPKHARSSADPYAGRYRREGNHDGQGALTDVASYELEKAVAVWNKPGENHLFPSLILAVGFHRPGRIIGHGVRLVNSASKLRKVKYLLADRAYNGGKIEDFHIPLRLQDVRLVIDYPQDDLGLQSSHEDLILVDGSWYVSYMPKDLIERSKTLRYEVKDPETGRTRTVTDEAGWEKLIRARKPYRMIPKGRPDKDGYQRYSYPKPGTYIAYDRGAKKRVMPQTARTISIPIDAGEQITPKGREPRPAIKWLQEFPYKSAKYNGFYGMRNLVESSNDLIKDGNKEDLANPRKRTGRGFAFHYLAATLAAVSSNLRRIATFFEADHKRATKPQERIRRRTTAKGLPLTHSSTTAAAPPE